jgi:hypothetical protein
VNLAEARTAVHDALRDVAGVSLYRGKSASYKFPCVIVGLPESMNVDPTMGDARDYVIPVILGVEVKHARGADEKMDELTEAVVDVLRADQPTWMVQTIEFSDELMADQRVVVWGRLPVAVWE